MTEHLSNPTERRIKKGLIRTHPRRSLIVYLILVLASNFVDQVLDSDRIYWGNLYADQHNALTVDVDTTGLAVNENPLKYRVIVEGDPDSTLPPVLLIHGSPGAAYGFEHLAPMLAEDGRRVLFFDLPGFASQAEPIFTRPSAFEDYSSDAYADILWRLLQAMGEHERVHLVGWSNGGAVALRMIEEHP
ncbi:MAG: alpha/beta fold hydrolase, partial [Phycisphaerales bacterium]|nr:alpha/beta fold hydrolase [Phycisphaerales bacterium]